MRLSPRLLRFILLIILFGLTALVGWQAAPMQAQSDSVQPPPPEFLVANEAGDTCATATMLTVTDGGTGGVTNVSQFTTESSDPTLTCTFGTPARAGGYRTAWYYFNATVNGTVTISTQNSNYDTVVQVYKDCNPAQDTCSPCAGLSLVSCNDDASGLTSHLTFLAQKDATYYIEVADYYSGVVGSAPSLSLAVTLTEPPTNWVQVLTNPLPPAISRHATAVSGSDLYVVGGKTSTGISNKLLRFEADTGQWVTSLPDIPGAGYANTTAALVDGKIYVPGGDNGSTTEFDGTHRVYDIANNVWSVVPSIGSPFGWATAVVNPNATANQKGYYLLGGLSSEPSTAVTADAVARNTAYQYFTGTNSWLTIASMSTPRYGHMAAWVNGRICVVGGLQGSANGAVLLNSGECLTPGQTSWTPIDSLNIARYGAGSAVGPDGRWYIFGGQANSTISSTEVYDPATNTWTVLSVPYDLGGSDTLPARFWPSGQFIGYNLFSVGGESESAPLPLMERLYLLPPTLYLPVVLQGGNSDDYPAVARQLALNVPQYHNFDTFTDLYDVFYFDLPSTKPVTVYLSQIPSNSNYDVFLYDANKLLRGSGQQPGQVPEQFTITLSAGRYYLLVERDFGQPTSSNYYVAVGAP